MAMLYFIVLACVVKPGLSDCRGKPDGTCLATKAGGTCTPPDYPYSRIVPVQIKQQWDNSGGYCGCLAVQTILQSQGAYVSQDRCRRAVPGTDKGPGTGAELYYANIGPALDTLKFRHDDWDWKHEKQPQWKNYVVWLKKHLAAGRGIVWMISDKSFEARNYTVSDGIRGPRFGHEEPVFAIYSKHPLTDTATYYEDDVLAHGSDYCAGAHKEGPRSYRTFKSLPDDSRMAGNCRNARGTIGQYPCIDTNQDLGFAVLGPVEAEASIPVSLMLDRFDEPSNNKMSIKNPANVKGTLTVQGPLVAGEQYTILRWDDFKKVPTNSAYFTSKYDSAHTFTAQSTTYVFNDPKTFLSSGTTYYRCVKGAPPTQVVV